MILEVLVPQNWVPVVNIGILIDSNVMKWFQGLYGNELPWLVL